MMPRSLSPRLLSNLPKRKEWSPHGMFETLEVSWEQWNETP